MSVDAADGPPPALVGRVRNIIFDPQTTWARIAAAEPAPLLWGHVAPLALLSALAGAGAELLYTNMSFYAALGWSPASAAVQFVSALAAVLAAGLVANLLAPRFGGEANGKRAAEAAGYSATPALIAGLSWFAPFVAPVFLLGGAIYTVVLFAFAARTLLKVPEARIIPFVLTSTLVFIVLAVATLAATRAVRESAREAVFARVAEWGADAPIATQQEAVRPPAEQAMLRLSRSHGAPILASAARLEQQFPSSLPGGFALRTVSSGTAHGAAYAEAVYGSDDAALSFRIVQFGRRSDIAALAAGYAPEGDARSHSIDGRFFLERLAAGQLRYAIIGRGVAVSVEGPITLDQARAAVETIGLRRLEQEFGR